MAKGSVTRKDSAVWKKLLASKDLEKSLWVGVPAGEKHPDTGASVAQIAAWNHFGTGRIPARPFLSLALDGRTTEVKRMTERVAKAILSAKPAEPILRAVGEWARNRVISFINRGVAPPNAASTIARKGSSTPLIDTGVLKGSISYLVKDGNG